jgi:hypothetical protein
MSKNKSKNRSKDKSPKLVSLPIPSEALVLFGPPPLLSTEKIDRYDAMLRAYWEVIQPQDMIEAFWVKDLTDIRWEMQRMRNLKTRLIEKPKKEKFKFGLDVLYASFQAEAAMLATWRGEPLVKVASEDTAKDSAKAENPTDADTKRPGESEGPAKAENPTDADTKRPGESEEPAKAESPTGADTKRPGDTTVGGEVKHPLTQDTIGTTKDPRLAADLNHLLQETAEKLRAMDEQANGDAVDVFAEWSGPYEEAERLELAAESRFHALLAEIDTYRQGFGERLRQVSDEIIDGEYAVQDEAALDSASPLANPTATTSASSEPSAPISTTPAGMPAPAATIVVDTGANTLVPNDAAVADKSMDLPGAAPTDFNRADEGNYACSNGRDDRRDQ